MHGVWKSQKKSHSTLRAKRATFTFWVDKSSLKMPKMVHFGQFLKTWSLLSNSVTRQVSFNRTKIGGKCQNSKIQMRHFGWFSNTVRMLTVQQKPYSKNHRFSTKCCSFQLLSHKFSLDTLWHALTNIVGKKLFKRNDDVQHEWADVPNCQTLIDLNLSCFEISNHRKKCINHNLHFW